MKKSIQIMPAIYPQPVLMLATYNEDGSVDVMNAAWGLAVDQDMLGVCLSPHKTTDNFKRTKGVTISLANSKYIADCDYLGIVSAKKVKDKAEHTSFHFRKASEVDAPVIEELPVCFECEYVRCDEESGVHFFKIKKLLADESVLDENGKLDVTKCDGVLFDLPSGRYLKIGEPIAKAYNVGLKLK